MMYPQNVPRYERHYDDGYSGPLPQEHARMVSPPRRGPMRQPHHRRQFSNESDDCGHTHTPPPHYHNHATANHGYPPPPNDHYSPTSPLRRMHGPSPYPPPMPYTHHPPIPLSIITLSDVNSQDVLCGQLVQEYPPEYLVARRIAKPTIAKTIAQLVRQRGGRFLIERGVDVRAYARGKKERMMRRKNWMKSFLHRDLRNKGTKIVGIQVQKRKKYCPNFQKSLI